MPVIVAIGTIMIGVLCYIWMKNSRASQTRMEAYDQRIIALLEEQNDLLRQARLLAPETTQPASDGSITH